MPTTHIRSVHLHGTFIRRVQDNTARARQASLWPCVKHDTYLSSVKLVPLAGKVVGQLSWLGQSRKALVLSAVSTGYQWVSDATHLRGE